MIKLSILSLALFSYIDNEMNSFMVSTSHTEVDSAGYVRDHRIRAKIPKADGPLSIHTSLTTKDGLALDPTVVRYVVVPQSHRHLLGTLVMVLDPKHHKKFYAVVGDIGPRFGEVSLKLAKDIDGRCTPWRGVERNILYKFYPTIKLNLKNQESLLKTLHYGI